MVKKKKKAGECRSRYGSSHLWMEPRVSAVAPAIRADPRTRALVRFCGGGTAVGAERGSLWKCPFWGQQVLLGSIDFQTSLLHPESQPPCRAKQRQEEAEEVP